MLKTALMRAWKYELIPTNPAQLVDPPRISRTRRHEITPEHVQALLDATAGSVRIGAMLQLACHVPLRPGELFGAEWSALDIDEATFDVRANLVRHDGEYLLHDTKTHERPTVPLAGAVADALRRHRVAQAEERRTDQHFKHPVQADLHESAAARSSCRASAGNSGTDTPRADAATVAGADAAIVVGDGSAQGGDERGRCRWQRWFAEGRDVDAAMPAL